ncbi:MAG: cobyrinic acid a,c-diamide synthase [Bradyrhizobiaceae bacterium]|nr:MAG: cobyrinic acid a,c-diamide synthase [Bradyrhizobiaceae bacterium]
MAHLFISAAHKSSGKTMVSVGLAGALRARGLTVQPFKKGPDYIDPMWLARVSGRPCYNLDFNTQTETEIRALFARHAALADLALIEGNKGLHDGVDLEGRDSSAALARLLGAPVVLVIDATGITRGVAPLVLGYRMFDREVVLGGVILNRVVSPRQESKLRQAIERYTDVRVMGAIGRSTDLVVQERHLGLTTPDETAARDETISRLILAVERGIDLDRVRELARSAPAVSLASSDESRSAAGDGGATAAQRDVRIAVARDAAFGFYYPDDLEALEQAGGELVFFNALGDARLPDADGLFIGGGFPETQMPMLSRNGSLRSEIRRAAESGLPIYAECGGLMYLTRSIRWGGEAHEMVGFIPADTVMHAAPQGRGLVVLEETDAFPWSRAEAQSAGAGRSRIPAHEFHHAALDRLDPATRFAYRVMRGHGVDGHNDGIVRGNVLAGFCHLRSTVRSGRWANRFVAFVRACKQARSAADSRFHAN